MKYMYVKVVQLVNLIERKKGGGIQWEKYGFDPSSLSENLTQGHDSYDSVLKKYDGCHCSLIPISDEEVFNNRFENLKTKCDSLGIEDALVDILDDSSEEFDTIKNSVIDAKAAFATDNL